MNPIVVNSAPFDSSPLMALSFVPIVLFLIWAAVSLGLLIFMVVMIVRFVRAHERIAKQLEAIALKSSIEPKDTE